MTYWTEHGSDPPYRDAVHLLLRDVHVRNGCAASREYGTTDESREESEREEHAEILRVDDTELKEYEREEGANVHRGATKIRYLGHGSLCLSVNHAIWLFDGRTQIIGPSA